MAEGLVGHQQWQPVPVVGASPCTQDGGCLGGAWAPCGGCLDFSFSEGKLVVWIFLIFIF